MTDDLPRVERKPIQERRKIAEIEGRQAMVEVRARDAFVRSNMEKLREARLAREQQEQAQEQTKKRAPARRRG
ncbi:transcriptional regulator [Bradyrhizobium prioriisuperbiae]|uniref:transcriptional regulator n=1 Tax=Bradyrhizobium prioriisuperbiae TaxID=2854389 RepID=UPI0028EBAA07|nr:transcriptional regulator [Bradyrhizobium prioritasuperba]